MIEVIGKGGIVARVVADSISESGVRLMTYEIEYPRIILAELNTHRMLSKNSASSRAIPFAKVVEQLTAKPVRFGQANAGMQDKGEGFGGKIKVTCPDGDTYEFEPEEVWGMARKDAISYAKFFKESDFHKQVYNRLLEPFQMMKTVISGTEWENFFWLRDDEAADPTIAELARCMREAREQSISQLLKAGEWHLPYVNVKYVESGPRGKVQTFWDAEDGDVISLEDAIKVSCARCAAVSYRGVDYGLEKCLQLYYRLVGSNKKHSSALEHCATPMRHRTGELFTNVDEWVNHSGSSLSWEEGISHSDREGNLWSGNFVGFIQYRKTIKGENYTK